MLTATSLGPVVGRMDKDMNYWMFTVMYYDDGFPTLWPTLVKRGLAAQHYPAGWTNEARNLNVLRQMREGDAVVAALKKHRFAGYGFLKSDFFRGGRPLPIERDREPYAFQERAEIDWVALPLDAARPYVRCRNLKAEGYKVDLTRGQCVKKIDKPTFIKLREILDKAGARVISTQPPRQEGDKVYEVLCYPEGKRVKIKTVRPERNPAARKECIRVHGSTCTVCGMSFADRYGDLGKGYIEVHHLEPLGGSHHQRIVDPRKDMRPVCPNCHAMLHRRNPVLSIEALRSRYRGSSSSRLQRPAKRRR